LPRWPRHVCFPLLYLSLCIVERFVGCTFAHAHTHTSACWRSKFVFRTDTPTHVGAQSLSSEQIRIPNRYTYARCRSKFVFRTDTHIEQVVDQSLSSHVGYTYARLATHNSSGRSVIVFRSNLFRLDVAAVWVPNLLLAGKMMALSRGDGDGSQ
jgi:hypothetical protein